VRGGDEHELRAFAVALADLDTFADRQSQRPPFGCLMRHLRNHDRHDTIIAQPLREHEGPRFFEQADPKRIHLRGVTRGTDSWP
jgi:hypothetical protein